ncbi:MULTISPECIES: TrmH family RNA methyltransferase [Actinoalloteichus]|uniref:rRNA methylase n=1 Tax=Actinoalloteichus fjordicus TaxID=1612552 RepID=A0AAC9LJ61_9PSEU|nr:MULTISPECIES: RNA methyltransferase [Actinoalloteichus]APU17305.1 rRNA methylase [Actinoalloteichus fjordicus]APU23388.1 rRNA methylase [Actinoalloteichus sp. GBA129-24]
MPNDVSPKDRFVTVYGRKPVLEALQDPQLAVDKVILAENAVGAAAREILQAAAQRDVPVQRATAQRVKVLAGNGRHDQGVLADVVAPRMRTLSTALAAGRDVPETLLLLDGITTPANVGMILRTATAAGIGGVVVPRRGVATIDPMVVKASAGVAFRAPILRTSTAGAAAEELIEAGFALYAMAADGDATLFEVELPRRVAFVLGGETHGVSEEVAELVMGRVAIPLADGVESLNVASAAAVLSFELTRRRLTSG